jgi:ubiquinone/menaquinone biosynthesis C-methylase UbiE
VSTDTTPPKDASREFARQLAADSIANGDATGWFESLYAAAEQGRTTVPWSDFAPNRRLVSALTGLSGRGRALVVGCGVGDDAEHVASLGFTTVAFDVSPTAIAGARRRFPRSRVDYVTADLLSPPPAWLGAFDLVVEVFTVQVLVSTARRAAVAGIARLVAPGGRLLVIAGAREENDDPGRMPWPLTRAEIESFHEHGLTIHSIVDFLDDEDGRRVRRWRAWFSAPTTNTTAGGTVPTTVDPDELSTKVKEMYRLVAEKPDATYHFELGRPLALRLGYDADLLDRVPAGAVDSFAGVGFFFDLAALTEGEVVLDLGSGSGMDACYAAHLVGGSGRVIGVDFTIAQLDKARRLANAAGLNHIDFREGRIESPPVDDASVDCVISNGVINLSPDKQRVFTEAARILRPGGRLAVADIVTEEPLTEAITSNTDLWASCIGGAAQRDDYRKAIEDAGLRVVEIRTNPYEFISGQARNASDTYGVKSISLLAVNAAR